MQCSAWSEIFDDMATVAMADRLIHHTELISLKGDRYHRLTDAPAGISLRSPMQIKRERSG